MQERGVLERDDGVVRELQRARDAHRQRGDAVRVRVDIGVAQRQHRQRRVERRVVLDAQRRQRVGQTLPPDLHLPFQRLAPSARLAGRTMPVEAAHDGLAQAVAAERLRRGSR